MRFIRWAAGLGVLGLLVAVPACRAAPASRGEGQAPPASQISDLRAGVLACSIAFVTAVSILGAAYAVGRIGSAALGASAEKPELLLRSLPLVGLAEGLAVIGFIVAIALLGEM